MVGNIWKHAQKEGSVLHFLRHAGYRTKMILSYLLIVTVPMVIGLYFLYNSLVRFNEDGIRRALEQQLEQYAAGVGEHMEDLEKSAYLLSTNTTLCQFVADSHATPVELIHRLTSDILPMCSWFEAGTSDFFDFTVFSDNADIPETEIFHPIDAYRGEAWFVQMEQMLSGTMTLYWEQAHSYHRVRYCDALDPVLTLYRKMLLTDSGRTGYFAISVSLHQLFSGVVSQPMMEDGSVIALDGNGALLAGSSPAYDEALFAQVARWPEHGLSLRASDGEYQSIRREIGNTGMYLAAVIPQSTFSYASHNSRQSFFLISAAAVGLTIALAIMLSNRLIARINVMVDAVHQIQRGDFNVRIDVKGSDEIDELAQNINVMSSHINELISTVCHAQTLQKETEIRALQAQINPHFLFNVLETFKMMAEINDDEKLADGITDLGRLIRYNISLSFKPTTLDEELQHLRSYIAIQNLMLNNRVLVRYDVEEDCVRAHVPRLLLQPLVENSIKHGFRARTGELRIDVCARMEGDVLSLRVTDNGCGMSEQALCSLCRNIYSETNNSDGGGIGLWNVNQRLRLIFGSSELHFISSGENQGFTVMVSIPQTLAEEVEKHA